MREGGGAGGDGWAGLEGVMEVMEGRKESARGVFVEVMEIGFYSWID